MRKKKEKKVMMYRLAWRYGAKFAIPTESYLCFLELGTGLQSGMVAYCIWGEVWLCVNSQLGPGRSCVQGCKGISKNRLRHREGWLWQGILRWFPICVHITSIYPGFTGAVDIPRWSAPQSFFFLFFFSFRRTFSSYFTSCQTVIWHL